MSYDPLDDDRVRNLGNLLSEHGIDGGYCHATGIVTGVLRWSVNHAPGGDLGRYAPVVIADAIDWKHGPELLMRLLREAQLIDSENRFLRMEEMYEAKKGAIKWIYGD